MSDEFKTEYAKYYDFFNEGKDYQEETDFIKEAINRFSDVPVKSILNLGCGTGEHEKCLSKEGFEISGVDLSEEMINVAKKKNIPNTKFSVGDMGKFELNEKFDMAMCMFAALGYVTENDKLKSTFETVKKHLKSGALFVFDVWNGLAVMNELPSSRIKEFDRNGIHVKRTSFPNLDSFNHVCEVNFDVEMTSSGETKKYQEKHFMRFFFPQEIIRYLEDAGFEVLEICKAFEFGKKVDEKEWNMAVVARLK